MSRARLCWSERRLKWTGQRRAGRVVGEVLRAHRRQVMSELDGLAHFHGLSCPQSVGRLGLSFEREDSDGQASAANSQWSDGPQVKHSRRSTARQLFWRRTRPVWSSAACDCSGLVVMLEASVFFFSFLFPRVSCPHRERVGFRFLSALARCPASARCRSSAADVDRRSGVQCSRVFIHLWLRI